MSDWLAATAASQWLQRSSWAIPLLQALHILSVSAVLGSAIFVAAWACGWGRSQAAGLRGRIFPWLWSGLAALGSTGSLLIVAEPARVFGNPAFEAKMALLACAAASTAALESSLRRRADFWRRRGAFAPGLAGCAVAALWLSVVAAGRLIAYLGAG